MRQSLPLTPFLVDRHIAYHGVAERVATVAFAQRSPVSNWQPRTAQLIRLPRRALKNPNHEPCTCKGRKNVSVGSVCVLGEPWLELLEPIVCCCCCVTQTLLSNFSGARSFSFLNEGHFSLLSPQSAAVFTKIGCKSGKFRARG